MRVLTFVKILMVSFILTCFMSVPAIADKGWTEVKAIKLKEMMQHGDVTVVFPLSKIEYNNLHIKGSVHIPMNELTNKLPASKEAKIVFYCLGRR